jgi:cation:H+ antiporter
MEIAVSLILIFISSIIIWRSTDGFELASDYLGRRLSKGIKGATINAVASSMPEFLSTIFFLFYLQDANGFSGGIGITGGSAVFNILVIPIAIYFVLLFSQGIKKIPIQRKTFMRDGLILLVMTGFVAWVVSFKELHWWHGALLAGPYAAYIVYLFIVNKNVIVKSDKFTYTPLNKGLKLKDFFLLNLEKIVLNGRTIKTASAWLILIFSILIMIAGTWMLVHATDRLGKELGIPILFVSVILSAAASSIPDTMISIRDAKKGNYEDAFSNALGSNIFDISFALGFPLLIYTLLNDPIIMDAHISQASAEIWLSLLAITALTVLIFGAGKNYNRFKAWLLVVVYLGFIAFVAIEVMNYSIF